MSLAATKTELEILIRARYPIIFCVTHEERRVQAVVADICRGRGAELRTWTRTKGFVKPDGQTVESTVGPDKALAMIEESNTKTCFLMLDFHPYVKDPLIVRKLRDLCHSLKLTKKNIILVSPTLTIPPELAKEIAVLEVPLPDRAEIRGIFDKIPSDQRADATDACVEAALGLTQEEIENVMAKSLVKNGAMVVDDILAEKKQIVAKAGILEFIPVKGGFDAVGGLENLKDWLGRRKHGFGDRAREVNLPPPKGLLLLGLPGCGKSLTANCTGAAWQMPLLRLDMGKIFSGLVGSSEENMRLALQTAESISPCILWIDEIEKGLSGTGGGDGGTTARVFGTFLTWMQEKEKPVFVLATANDISGLPPEMLRKGRFDEIFYVDLPTATERVQIIKIHAGKRGWTIEGFDDGRYLTASENFSGAEIEQALIDARYEAFFHERALSMDTLESALTRTVPLFRTMREKIQDIRRFAAERAVSASRREPMGTSTAAGSSTRELELLGHADAAGGQG